MFGGLCSGRRLSHTIGPIVVGLVWRERPLCAPVPRRTLSPSSSDRRHSTFELLTSFVAPAGDRSSSADCAGRLVAHLLTHRSRSLCLAGGAVNTCYVVASPGAGFRRNGNSAYRRAPADNRAGADGRTLVERSTGRTAVCSCALPSLASAQSVGIN
jgi:hypothetical protein